MCTAHVTFSMHRSTHTEKECAVKDVKMSHRRGLNTSKFIDEEYQIYRETLKNAQKGRRIQDKQSERSRMSPNSAGTKSR